MTLLELERQIAGNDVSIRRQIIELGGTTWVVIDSGDGPTGSTIDRIWTTMPETQLQRINDREYLMTATDVPEAARISFLGQLSAAPRVRVGEREPFAGWIVRKFRPTPAPSFEVRHGVPSLAVTVLSVGAASAAVPRLEEGSDGPENWRIVLRDSTSERFVQRMGDRLVVSHRSDGDVEIRLSAVASDALEHRQSAVAAFEAAALKYKKPKQLTHYRYNLSWLMLGLLVIQELTIVVVRRWSNAGGRALRWTAAAAWIALGLFAYGVYLR